MSSTQTDTSIAYEIARQIGNRAFIMMGSGGSVCSSERGLTFKVKGSKAFTHVRITLNADDTYKVSFYKFRGVNCVAVKDVDGIYVAQLRSVISENTGLALSL